MINKFLDELKSKASIVYKDNKILRDICIAQGILESNLFNTPSKLASQYNNLFGIKKAGTLGIVLLPTTEYYNKVVHHIKQPFGVNRTIEDSVKQHREVLSLSRYKKVWEAKTYAEGVYALMQGGYATDPRYATKLIQIHQDPRAIIN